MCLFSFFVICTVKIGLFPPRFILAAKLQYLFLSESIKEHYLYSTYAGGLNITPRPAIFSIHTRQECLHASDYLNHFLAEIQNTLPEPSQFP